MKLRVELNASEIEALLSRALTREFAEKMSGGKMVSLEVLVDVLNAHGEKIVESPLETVTFDLLYVRKNIVLTVVANLETT